MNNLTSDQFQHIKLTVLKEFSQSTKKHLLITGSKNSGKTTVLDELLKEENSLGGIVTYAVRDDNIPPMYVKLQDINDPKINGKIAVRNYSNTALIPLTQTFDCLGTSILNRYIHSKVELIVIDEIGYLENAAKEYQAAILCCMEKKKAIFVIKKELTPFIEKLIKRQDVLLIDISHINSSYE